MLDWFDWSDLVLLIIGVFLFIMSSFFGAKYKQFKALARSIVDAWEDDKLTEAEWDNIVSKFKELFGW